MGIKIIFVDGTAVEYPQGVIVSEAGLMKHVLDAQGDIVASFPAAQYKGVIPA
jgi:hypothetical protein